MLFIPWRDEAELLYNHTSYESKFNSIINDAKFNIESYTLLNTQREKIENAIKYAISLRDNSNSSSSDSENEFNLNNLLGSIDQVALEIPDIQFSESELQIKIDQLNNEQLEVFNAILNSIENQSSNENAPINIFCSGVAGI